MDARADAELRCTEQGSMLIDEDKSASQYGKGAGWVSVSQLTNSIRSAGSDAPIEAAALF